MAKSSCDRTQKPTFVETVSFKDYMLRGILFLIYITTTIVLLQAELKKLTALFLGHNELYSHIILIPLVSCYLLFSRRKEVFSRVNYSYSAGGLVIIAGLIVFIAGMSAKAGYDINNFLSFMACSLVIFCIGGFILFFGVSAARKAAFPLLFLLFMVPIPSAAVKIIITVLQKSSAEVVNGLFAITGIPYLRDGFTFHLQTLSIEVAEQCSGIRSSLVLFIISVLSGHLFLKTKWHKIALSLAVFPITIFKNGVRILTLSLLGAYVDKSILSSALHRRGGIPFFVMAMMLFAVVLWMLRQNERGKEKKYQDAAASLTEESR